MRTYIIAEAGINHNGSRDLAFRLIDAAVAAGADAAKFQTFVPERNISVYARKANYQLKNTSGSESQLEMVEKLALDFKTFRELRDYCKQCNIDFLSTAFDKPSLDFLVDELDVKALKIASGELVNAPLLLEHAKTGKPLIMSTGMATLGEIEDALGVIAYGRTVDFSSMEKKKLTIHDFREAYWNKVAMVEGSLTGVSLLHCSTEYPAPFDGINLNVIEAFRAAFSLEVGYSDHSVGIEVPIAAVAKGATIIEKHYTLDKNMEGPDHKASLTPEELRAMVEGIRNIEVALGNSVKVVQPCEVPNRQVARKSIVASRDIKKGETLTEECLDIKRPGTGLSPYLWWECIGQRAIRDFKKDEPLVI